MKKIIFFSAIALLVLATMSCNKEENKTIITKQGKLNVKNLSYGDCKSNSLKSTKKEYLELIADGKYLKIKHVNSVFNCCPGEISVNSKISNDTIFIDENEKEHACNCICNYDLNYKIGTLEYGKYTVILNKLHTPFIKFYLDFNPNTNKIININH